MNKKLVSFGFMKLDPENLDKQTIDELGSDSEGEKEEESCTDIILRSSKSKTQRAIRSMLA